MMIMQMKMNCCKLTPMIKKYLSRNNKMRTSYKPPLREYLELYLKLIQIIAVSFLKPFFKISFLSTWNHHNL